MQTNYAPKENSYLDYKGWEYSAFTQGTKAFLKIKETSGKCLSHQTMLMPDFLPHRIKKHRIYTMSWNTIWKDYI